jgi:hypothetical protein
MPEALLRGGRLVPLLRPNQCGLRTRHDLGPAVQPGQLVWADPELGGCPRSGVLRTQIRPLVVAGGPVLLDEPLVHP